MPELLAKNAVISRMAEIPAWNREGNEISRSFDFPTFPDGIEFVRRVADLAENANHHPDIDIRWRTVKLVLTTHSAGGLTDLDFDLAGEIDALLES